MWKMAGAADDKSPAREAQISMKTIATKVAISKRNLRRVLRSLENKLAIEVTEYEDKQSSTPRRYRIWGFRAAIERRRQAGYNFVYRSRNLITLARLVAPPGVNLSAGAGDKLTPDPADSLSRLPEDSVAAAPPDNLRQNPEDKLSANIRKILKNTSERTTSPLLVAALRETMGRSDDDAAIRILLACREATPDITEEEIAHFIRLEGPSLRANRALDNPMGVLIRHVPRCCRGESLRLHREAVKLEQEQKQRQIAGWLRDATAILADPTSDPMDRAWAVDILNSHGAGNSRT